MGTITDIRARKLKEHVDAIRRLSKRVDESRVDIASHLAEAKEKCERKGYDWAGYVESLDNGMTVEEADRMIAEFENQQ